MRTLLSRRVKPLAGLEQLEARTVLNGTLDLLAGHVDGIALDYLDGAWVATTEDKDNDIRYDAGVVNPVAVPGTRVARPAGSQFDFLGVPDGADVWVLRQNQLPDQLYLGANAERTPPGSLAAYFESDPRVNGTDSWIRVQVTAVRGPGQFSMWQAGFFGGITTFVSTADGLTADDAFFLSEGSHTHYNWAFTARGYYEVDVQATAYLGPDMTDPTTSPVFTYFFSAERPGFLQFDSATYTQTEAGTLATITVTRTRGADGTVAVDYATADGTATAGTDYTPASGTLTFLDGETSKTFTVLLADDGPGEGPETVNLVLSGAAGGAKLGGQSTAVLTITDDVPAPPGPLLADGGFEAPGVGAGGFEYAPTGTAWAYSATAGVSGNGSAFTGGSPGAPEGGQVAFLQGAGSIAQTVTLVPGTYALTFRAAQRGNDQPDGPQTVRADLAGTAQTFTPAGTGYETLTATFAVATAGGYTLTLDGLVGGDSTVLLDDIQLTLVG
ncbi:MAG: hypothetical protein C0501_19110 [Isosphaera sp.]|nr:hypothetical protein [Isosphaera sp.]